MLQLLSKQTTLLLCDRPARLLLCDKPKSFDFDGISDMEWLDETFDLSVNQEAEELFSMTEEQFDLKVVKDCIEDIVTKVECSMTRMPSFEPIESIQRNNSLYDVSMSDTEGKVDISGVFSEESEPETETESESDPESDSESDTELPDMGAFLEDELEESRQRIEELEKENESLREKLKRSREENTEFTPVKRRKISPVGEGRNGCPFCPYECKRNGYDKRTLKDHLTNGTCEVPTSEMVNTRCIYSNPWCNVGDSGFQCLLNMGFKDPYNHVRSFRNMRCPHCEFTTYNKRNLQRHFTKKINLGGHGMTLSEAKQYTFCKSIKV